MTHREDNKETKRANKESKKPDVIHVDEMKKNPIKGVIKGNE